MVMIWIYWTHSTFVERYGHEIQHWIVISVSLQFTWNIYIMIKNTTIHPFYVRNNSQQYKPGWQHILPQNLNCCIHKNYFWNCLYYNVCEKQFASLLCLNGCAWFPNRDQSKKVFQFIHHLGMFHYDWRAKWNNRHFPGALQYCVCLWPLNDCYVVIHLFWQNRASSNIVPTKMFKIIHPRWAQKLKQK